MVNVAVIKLSTMATFTKRHHWYLPDTICMKSTVFPQVNAPELVYYLESYKWYLFEAGIYTGLAFIQGGILHQNCRES